MLTTSLTTVIKWLTSCCLNISIWATVCCDLQANNLLAYCREYPALLPSCPPVCSVHFVGAIL